MIPTEKREYIESLQDAILRLHGCSAEYVKTVPVAEVFRGETVWQGEVEVFKVRGHPGAKRAYAWSHADGDDDAERRFVAVLELPPVTSPETAVKAAVMHEIRSAREKT